MSVRIGAALRRELPALDELRAREPSVAGAEGQELALQTPAAPASSRPPTVALQTAAPPRPSLRALASLGAVTSRLAEPGALASLGEAAGPVHAMLEALGEVLALGDAVERTRRGGVRA